MYMKKRLLMNFIFLPIICFTMMCQDDLKNAPKYPWNANVDGAPHYEVAKLMYCYLSYIGKHEKDNKQWLVAYPGTVGSSSGFRFGWGYDGLSDAAGNNLHGIDRVIPNKLEVMWLSRAEVMSYKGSFELPQDTIARIFEEGYIDDNNEKGNYDRISIGLCPKGIVIVWVADNGVSTREIGRFQAEEVKGLLPTDIGYEDNEMSLKEICSYEGDDDSEAAKAYIAKHGLREGLWDRYRERYNLTPELYYMGNHQQAVNPNDTALWYTEDGYIRCFNGEGYILPYEYWITNESMQLGRIVEYSFSYVHGKHLFYGIVVFDEDEVLEAYDAVYGDNREQPGYLVVRVSPSGALIRVELITGRGTSQQKKYTFKKAQIEWIERNYKECRPYYRTTREEVDTPLPSYKKIVPVKKPLVPQKQPPYMSRGMPGVRGSEFFIELQHILHQERYPITNYYGQILSLSILQAEKQEQLVYDEELKQYFTYGQDTVSTIKANVEIVAMNPFGDFSGHADIARRLSYIYDGLVFKLNDRTHHIDIQNPEKIQSLWEKIRRKYILMDYDRADIVQTIDDISTHISQKAYIVDSINRYMDMGWLGLWANSFETQREVSIGGYLLPTARVVESKQAEDIVGDYQRISFGSEGNSDIVYEGKLLHHSNEPCSASAAWIHWQLPSPEGMHEFTMLVDRWV